MVVSMLDQTLFPLACGHELIFGRMTNLDNWICETCGPKTDLTAEPFKSALVRDLNAALEIDLQERKRERR
jgi:hypothetical protein